jgi:hypothetical protein
LVKVEASHKSIQRQIEDHIKNPFDAFNEFIWNSLDANAKNVEITIETGTNSINKMEIVDDGDGINYEKLKDDLFGKFNTSLRAEQKEKNHSLPRGDKGFGRFAFIKFASKAQWQTVYHDEKSGKDYYYTIEIDAYKLDDFNPSEKKETEKKTSTKVIFTPHKKNTKRLLSLNEKYILQKLLENICLEFAWIIELFGINISLNGKKIDYLPYLEERISHNHKIGNSDFEFKFIKWKRPLKDQSSRYYCLNSKGEEVFVNTTTLNDKSDEFYHSLIIRSEFFNDFDLMKIQYDPVYIELTGYIIDYLKKQRRPYLKNFSAKKYKEFEEMNLLPKFNQFESLAKKPIYEEVVKEIIEFAPSLASNSNNSQKKILLELINRLLDDEQSRKILYSILEVLIDEDNKDQLEELDKNLRKYGLKNILGTIRIVEGRLNLIKKLRSMVYENAHYFSESDLQKEIEQHFWIFGEEYNLMVCKEEDDFTKLRNLYYEKVLKLKKGEYEHYFISKRQVDLFICGDVSESRKNKNMIVEIKTPDSNLTKEHYRQIEDYKDVILNMPELNSPDRNQWAFILLYTDISKDHKVFFETQIIDTASGLVKESPNKDRHDFKIFVIKWADLLDEVEFRLRFLKDKLESRKPNFIPKKEVKEESKEGIMKWADNSAERN